MLIMDLQYCYNDKYCSLNSLLHGQQEAIDVFNLNLPCKETLFTMFYVLVFAMGLYAWLFFVKLCSFRTLLLDNLRNFVIYIFHWKRMNSVLFLLSCMTCLMMIL